MQAKVFKLRFSITALALGAMIGAAGLAIPLSASNATMMQSCNNGDCHGATSCNPMVENNCRFWFDRDEGKWKCTNSSCNET